MSKRNKSGVTLIELIVLVAIISITIAGAFYLSITDYKKTYIERQLHMYLDDIQKESLTFSTPEKQIVFKHEEPGFYIIKHGSEPFIQSIEYTEDYNIKIIFEDNIQSNEFYYFGADNEIKSKDIQCGENCTTNYDFDEDEYVFEDPDEELICAIIDLSTDLDYKKTKTLITFVSNSGEKIEYKFYYDGNLNNNLSDKVVNVLQEEETIILYYNKYGNIVVEGNHKTLILKDRNGEGEVVLSINFGDDED